MEDREPGGNFWSRYRQRGKRRVWSIFAGGCDCCSRMSGIAFPKGLLFLRIKTERHSLAIHRRRARKRVRKLGRVHRSASIQGHAQVLPRLPHRRELEMKKRTGRRTDCFSSQVLSIGSCESCSDKTPVTSRCRICLKKRKLPDGVISHPFPNTSAFSEPDLVVPVLLVSLQSPPDPS